MTRSVRFALAAALIAGASPAAAQADRPIPCAEGGESPGFLSAANDIQYACGYLVRSRPPQWTLAATNLRQALAKEPQNADALLLLALTTAASGTPAEAAAALAEAERVEPAARDRMARFLAARPEVRTALEAATAVRAAPTPAAVPAPPRATAPRQPDAPTTPTAPGTPPRAECGGSRPNCPPTAPPPPGRYTCDQTRWNVATRRIEWAYQGYFELLPGGRYRWLDNGGGGTYRYDATTHRVHWTSGPLQARGGRAEFGLDGRTPEITITLDNAYSQQTGNAAPVWQCGLSRR